MNTPSSKESANGKLAATVVLAHGFVLAFLMTLPWTYPLAGLTTEAAVYAACWMLVGLFAWSLATWRVCAGSWFDPYSLFFVAAFLFNGGQALLEVFGMNPAGLLDGQFSAETTLAALYLTLLGLAAMHWGALMSAASHSPACGGMVSDRATSVPHLPDETVRRVGWGMILLSLPFNVLLLRNAIEVVLTSGYFGLYQRDMPTGLGAAGDILAHFLVPGVCFVVAGGRNSAGSRAATGAILFAYALVQLFLGYRYYAAMPVIAYAWLWHRLVRPLPVWLLLACVVPMLAVFTLVRLTRDAAGEERLSVDYLSSAWSGTDFPLASSVREMGSTLETVAHTLELVPEVRPYDLGGSYGYALLTLVPNLFWDVHPSGGEHIPGNWLTRTVAPDMADAGGGLGFSVLAEAYLNFGWPGAPVVLWLLGLLYARFVLWAQRSGEPARMAAVAAFAASFTLSARGEASLFVRTLVWYVFVPYALIVFSGVRGQRSGVREEKLTVSSLATGP
jgi:hypothetical protein